MISNFESCKESLKYQYKNDNWSAGLPHRTLKPMADEVLKNGEKVSVARAKADAVAYILRNAQIDINPGEIFADKINHCGIMQEYLAKRNGVLKTQSAKEAGQKAALFSASGSFDANLDFGHISPDWDFLISNGVTGVIERLEKYRDGCGADSDKKEFYDECIEVYKSIIDLMLRMAEVAEQNGTENNLFMAANLRRLAKSKPETMAQAMQLSLLIYNIQTNIDTTIIRSLGGIDHMYYPLYKNDLESGAFTEAELREIIRYFFWKISAMNVIANMPFYICGTDSSGNDMTNPLTYVLLEEYGALDIYDPKIHIMYSDKTPKQVVISVLEMIRQGKSSFLFMNTDVAKASLEKLGISPKDASRLTVYGCYEPAAEGTEIPGTCAGQLNMAKAVEFALHNGLDTVTNKKVGLETGEDFKTFEEFYSAVKKQLAFLTESCMEILSTYDPFANVVNPSPIMSATYECSVERGKDLYCGGAKYSNTSVVGLGLATLVDSCLAVKKAVYEDKKLTFSELKKALLNNFKGE